MTAAKQTEAYKKLNIHMSVYNELQVARDILFAYIMLSADFDPANLTDMKYLWDLSYSFQWGDSTRQRFVKDAEQLAEGHWEKYRIKVPDSKNVDQLKTIFQKWFKVDSNFPVKILADFAEKRYTAKSYFIFLLLLTCEK